MKLKPLKAAVAGLVTVAIAGAGMVAFTGAAFAGATNPPFEPDGNAAAPYGNVVFYDASGNQITSGSNDLGSPFAYAVAATAADTGTNQASLSFANPQNGIIPGNWGVTGEAGPTVFSPSSSLPTGTPADIVAEAPIHPVVETSAADISTWLASTVTDTTAGYANTVQVRITDSGPGNKHNAPGTYWESDIGYNTTNAPILVDGTTVPAEGWAVLFPFQATPTVTLATNATGGQLTTPNSITLTATVSSTLAGSVVFSDNGTPIDTSTTPGSGSYTYTYTPGVSTNAYTAIFEPNFGDESGSGTASAAFLTNSAASNTVNVNVAAPLITTQIATLNTNQAAITYGNSVTFSATATASGSTTPAGTVEFFVNGSTPISGCTAVAINAGGTASTAQCSTTSLPQSVPPTGGTDAITAVFSPTSPLYAVSPVSTALQETVTAPSNSCSYASGDAAPLTSPCQDPQNIETTINPGTITVTTPYGPGNPFVLPAMQLSSDGTYFQTSAAFPNATDQPITVTSTLAPAYAWTLSVSATPLQSGANSIPASGIGLTGGTLNNATGAGAYPGSVTFTGIPAHNPSPVDTDTNSGLTSSPQTFAVSSAIDGTALMSGTLTVDAATSTPSGTYAGTITFSVA